MNIREHQRRRSGEELKVGESFSPGLAKVAIQRKILVKFNSNSDSWKYAWYKLNNDKKLFQTLYCQVTFRITLCHLHQISYSCDALAKQGYK